MSPINWNKVKKKISHEIEVKDKVFYEVLWVDEFKDGKTRGEARFKTKQLVLLKNMSPKLTVETFIHELMHIFCHEYGVGLTEKQVLAMESTTPYLLHNIWSLKF